MNISKKNIVIQYSMNKVEVSIIFLALVVFIIVLVIVNKTTRESEIHKVSGGIKDAVSVMGARSDLTQLKYLKEFLHTSCDKKNESNVGAIAGSVGGAVGNVFKNIKR